MPGAITPTLAEVDAHPDDDMAALPRPGDRIGGFVVERTLGAGAMGIVLLARDAELQRHVAVKLLVPRHGEDLEAQRRLLREAQSVAQLQHPNVVALHQVGMHEGRVFLVMEYVDGGTLRQWASGETRTWREIVGVYLQAAAGLTAAHAAGLVHRDFKPDNALIGRDGRVRVSDFGLVGAPSSEITARLSPEVDVRLTQTGALLGTPAYMSPEQFAGSNVDAAADQFAFCVALYEALHGRRPFAGDNPAALWLAIREGEIRPAVRGRGVPRGVHRAIVRGLAADPDRRHASMAALADALASPPSRGRVRIALAGVAIATAGGLGFVAASGGPTSPTPAAAAAPACPGVEAELEGVWDDARRDAVRTSLGAAAIPLATATAERTIAMADAYASALSQARHAACTAHATMPAPDADARAVETCIDDLATALDAASDLVAEAPSVAVAAWAPAIVAELPPVETCADLEALRARGPAPDPTRDPEKRSRRAELVHTVVTAQLLAIAGDTSASAGLVDHVPGAAIELGAPSLAAEAQLVAARAAQDEDDFETAEARLREAVANARTARDRLREAVGLGDLMVLLARATRVDEALALREQAEAAADAAGSEARWRLQERLAGVLKRADRAAEADAAASLAVDLLRAASPQRPIALARALHTRGEILSGLKRLSEACDAYAEGLEAIDAALGPGHVARASLLVPLAHALARDGDVEAARERFAEAERLLAPDIGGNHAALARLLLYRADLERTHDRHDAAAVDLQAAIARWDEDPRHEEQSAAALVELGIVEFMRGRLEAADAALDRAAEISARHPGSRVVDIARLEGMAGGVAIAQGDLSAGRAHHERRLAALERAHGPTHPLVALSHTDLGDISLYLGDCASARASFRRGLKVRVDLDLRPDADLLRLVVGQATCDAIDGDVDDARDGIARVEREQSVLGSAPFVSGRLEVARAELSWRENDRAAARAHARRALAIYEALGSPYRLDADHVQAWLASHGA
jgi:tetratricopeptide (TPR) repeat protein